MSEDTPFLRTIMEHPHDTEPRLVFADWLEERGDPWAELIRLQCTEIGSVDRCLQLIDKLAVTIVQRMWKIHPTNGYLEMNYWKHANHWWYESILDGSNSVKIFFRRGMPERVAINYLQWYGEHYKYMKTFPISGVQLTRAYGTWSVESALRTAVKYAGQLTMLDLPYLPELRDRWVRDILHVFGKKCVNRPFLLKIGLINYGTAWEALCMDYLQEHNVRILLR